MTLEPSISPLRKTWRVVVSAALASSLCLSHAIVSSSTPGIATASASNPSASSLDSVSAGMATTAGGFALRSVSTGSLGTTPGLPTFAHAIGSVQPVCELDNTLRSLTRRELFAQTLTAGIDNLEQATQLVKTEKIGGVFVQSSTHPDFLRLKQATQLHAQSQLPLLVSIDEEGGRVSRISSLDGPFPSARWMAQFRSPAQVRGMGYHRGKQLAARGITVDFAPVLDLSDRGNWDVIGDRSFSSNPAVAADFALAFAHGLRDAGVKPVFKHFPGHGRANGDSHVQVTTTPPLDQLLAYDLLPYHRAVQMPGAAIMVGHLIVPGLTEKDIPSSLSGYAYALLRRGHPSGLAPFKGVIFTDDLGEMKAISLRYNVPGAVLRSLQAGADSPLWIRGYETSAVLDRLEAAAENKEISMQRIFNAAKRMLIFKGYPDCSRT